MVDMISTSGAAIPAGGANLLGGDSGGLGSLLSNNPNLLGALGAGVGAIGLLSNNQVPFTNQIQGIAGQLQGTAGQQAGLLPQFQGISSTAGGVSSTLGGQGQQLLSSLITGTLPAGAEAQVKQATTQATNTTKSKFAQLGLTGSTMESQALSDIQQNEAVQRFQIEQQMAQTGLQAIQQSLSALGLSTSALSAGSSALTGSSYALGQAGQQYDALMKAQMQQNKDLFSSISGFASALGKAMAVA